MKTARYTYRFYPSQAQAAQINRTFGCARFVFNWGLAAQLEAKKAGEKMPGSAALDRALTQLKKTEELAWLAEVSCVPLQQSLRDLGAAWTNCFEGRAKRPRFKRKFASQSIRYTKRVFSIRGGKVYRGADHDRDINAARNIAQAAGLAVRNVCGEETSGHGEQLLLFA